MTSRLRILTAATASALLLTLAACSPTPSADTADTAETAGSSAAATADTADGECTGVTVVVDASAFGEADDISRSNCIDTDTAIAATDAVNEAGVITEGTTEYGDQVVCRVDGLPAADFALVNADGSEHFETCESMPAAFAYWGLWVKPADGEWEYAQEPLSTLELQPGESVALQFSLNGEPAAPTS